MDQAGSRTQLPLLVMAAGALVLLVFGADLLADIPSPAIGAIVGDFYAGNSAGGSGGLGFLTIIYSSQFKMGALFATAAVSCVLGFIFVAAVVSLSWVALHKWHESFSTSDH